MTRILDGDWSVQNYRGRANNMLRVVQVTDGVTRGVARVNSLAEEEEVARLIASAPDLLEALEAHDAYMSVLFEEGPDAPHIHPHAKENWLRARTAISKATLKDTEVV